MKPPYPIIYLPKPEDQNRLLRALYKMGYRYSMISENDGEDDMVTSWNKGDLPRQFPYVYIDKRHISAYCRRDHGQYNTLVNSIPHFLDYTRRHFANKS